jgi:Na+-transporting NADH:ubiquinone oxidoreductase subunit C
MKRGPLYTVLFAAALGVACAALLTGARELTAARRAENEKADQMRHILDVLGVDRSAARSNRDLMAVYEANVKVERRGGLNFYRYEGPGGQVRAVAVPFSGQGLWGTIKGYLALEPDLKTLRRVTFYEHVETPGLGAEIEKPAFRLQFEGMRVLLPDGTVGLQVQGIPGATLTSKRVRAMLQATLEEVLKAPGTEENHGR